MTRDDVLKEFVDCHCSYVCECYEFVYEAMADEIVALRAERDALRALVKLAYYFGRNGSASDACEALKVQPNDKPTWKHIEPRDAFETEWTILP